jgi:ketosteroid isomerase-like protein
MIAFMVSAVAAASQAAPAPAPRSAPAIAPSRANASVVAQIRQLEQDWGQAFVKRDYAFLERIVAPEYRVATVAPDGRVALTYREEWMRNTRNFRVDAFAAEVVDVTTAGDTAVALVHGLWTVQRSPDRPAESIRFFVTDTWTRRNGRWQVIHRYSQRLPQAPWPPLRQGAAEATTKP